MYLAFNYLKLNDKWSINYIEIRPFELMDKIKFSFLKFLRKYVAFKVKTKQAVCTVSHNQALTFCDLNTSWYQTHSFRIGAASWAAARGFSDSQIMPFRR